MVSSSLATIACPTFGVLCVNVDPDRFSLSGPYGDDIQAEPIHAIGVDEAFEIALNERTPVVVCREDAPGGGWQALLQRLQTLPEPPKVIVHCSKPDPGTWARVLTAGGFDVVSPATSPDSLLRTLRAAYERQCRQMEINAARKTCVRALSETFAHRMYA